MKLKNGKSYINVTYPKFKMGDEVLREVAEPPTYGMFSYKYCIFVQGYFKC